MPCFVHVWKETKTSLRGRNKHLAGDPSFNRRTYLTPQRQAGGTLYRGEKKKKIHLLVVRFPPICDLKGESSDTSALQYCDHIICLVDLSAAVRFIELPQLFSVLTMPATISATLKGKRTTEV